MYILYLHLIFQYITYHTSFFGSLTNEHELVDELAAETVAGCLTTLLYIRRKFARYLDNWFVYITFWDNYPHCNRYRRHRWFKPEEQPETQHYFAKLVSNLNRIHKWPEASLRLSVFVFNDQRRGQDFFHEVGMSISRK